MRNGFKDWKLKIDKFMDTPYGVQIGILAVILLAFFTIAIIEIGNTTPDEQTKPDEQIKHMIQKASFEGHDYLIYRSRGICHSPNCRCYDKGSK